MAKKETAEQKLLRIIEDSPKDDSAPASTAAAGANGAGAAAAAEIAVAVKGPSLGVPAGLTTLLGSFSNIFGSFSGKSFGLKQVNTLLFILIVLACIGLVGVYRSETGILQGELDFSKGVKSAKGFSSFDPVPQYAPLTSFLDVVLERNIFRPYEKKEVAVISAPTGKEKITVKMQDLKLVGISWLDTPDSASAMVELKTGMTVFLREGERADDVFVKKIFADRVIFTYQDQEMEVRL